MSWKLFMGRWKKHQLFQRICDYYQSVLHKCLIHLNNLYEKRYIFRHVYVTNCKKIEEAQTILNTFTKFKLRELIQIMDTIVFSCGLSSVSEILDYLAIPPLKSQHLWVDTLGFPIILSKERGGIGTAFFRAPTIIGQNSFENTRGVWMSVPGTSNVHYAIRMIIERDVLGVLPKAFTGKLRLLEKQDYIELLPEKYIITETATELRSRIDTMIKTRERLGKTPVGKVIREFMNADIPKQVKLFSSMMIPEQNGDLSHLLTVIYDIHANQTIVHRKNIPDLIDSLPWKVQQHIRELRNHKSRTDTVSEEDIPDETKIQMLKTDKATIKLALSRLREAKARGGGGGIVGTDGASKAGAWVEGLLQIPFGVYRKEPILCLREETYEIISNILTKKVQSFEDIRSQCETRFSQYVFFHTEHQALRWTRDTIIHSLRAITSIKQLREISKILDIPTHTTKRLIIQNIVEKSSQYSIPELYNLIQQFGGSFPQESQPVYQIMDHWNRHLINLQKYLTQTQTILDTCIYRQERAKEQVLRLLGQWMVGENRGYCIGFEGPPGVGKTTLARDGIPKILSNTDGTPRPFHMIALGTATTGSTFVGHNYTYHGSTWGDIVRFLMDSQCMNPIIYIDELDKVSMTESGREIIGILTHLTDSAQNEEFQDRYFAGVKLDVSRILFIFSYNDPSKIDPILLDRIHRIQFEPFTVSEKVEIVQNYTLPEILNTLCLPSQTGMISKEDIRQVIQNYTYEPGIRKLREILFDIYREVNLQGLHSGQIIPPTLEFIEKQVLSHRQKPHRTLADCQSKPNRVFGMFATSSGMGGILPIRITKIHKSSSSSKEQAPDVILTGSLGDVMKESVRVAKTVVGQFVTPDDISGAGAGAHLHFPQGATPKDGPSAGAAITLALWSFYTNTEIPGNLAITGEIDLDGMILPVGGIREKLVGARADGIEIAYIPKANERDYEIAKMKLPEQELPKRVEFLESFEELLQKIKH